MKDRFALLRAEDSDDPQAHADVAEFLHGLGYLKNRDSEPPAVARALRHYQRFMGVPITGTTDHATLSAMSCPRCGRGDVGRLDVENEPWKKSKLTWAVTKAPTNDLSLAKTRAAIAQAFSIWSGAVPLTFVEKTSGSVDIEIGFMRGAHGDGTPFRGVGHQLAHAFPPPVQPSMIAGDIHFDDEETWAVKRPIPQGSYDLVTVAAHEIGHSLGLEHSSVYQALMYPGYHGVQRHLAQDDKDRIRALYG